MRTSSVSSESPSTLPQNGATMPVGILELRVGLPPLLERGVKGGVRVELVGDVMYRYQ